MTLSHISDNGDFSSTLVQCACYLANNVSRNKNEAACSSRYLIFFPSLVVYAERVIDARLRQSATDRAIKCQYFE